MYHCCVAITVKNDLYTVLLVNVYAPIYNRGPVPSEDLFEMLDEVEQLIESVQHNAILLAFDWNYALSRNTAHCQLNLDFWNRTGC